MEGEVRLERHEVQLRTGVERYAGRGTKEHLYFYFMQRHGVVPADPELSPVAVVLITLLRSSG
jgi:hypothetical protein